MEQALLRDSSGRTTSKFLGLPPGSLPTAGVRPPHCAERQPGRMQRGGAWKARWRGQPLHCTGCRLAVGSGRLLWGWSAGCSRRRPLHGPGRHPAISFGWLWGSNTCRTRRRGSAYGTRAAIRQPALAGCWRLVRAKPTGSAATVPLQLQPPPHGGVHHLPCSCRSHTCGFRRQPNSLG
jgi:hypothetical protein